MRDIIEPGIEIALCIKCGNRPRFSFHYRTCRECYMAARKIRGSRGPAAKPLAAAVESQMNDLVCNHCKRKIPTVRELGEHKRTHNFYKTPKLELDYSITSSAQSWND